MKKTLSSAKEALDGRLASSDALSAGARNAKIAADRAMALLHSGKRDEAMALLSASTEGIARLKSAISSDPTLYYANFQLALAFQEYAEARFLVSALAREPEFPDLDVPVEAYILGLADAAGELNRAFLEARIRGDGAAASFYLAAVRRISEAFSDFDYPDFIIPSFRRKKDFVRGILSSMLSVLARDGRSGPLQAEPPAGTQEGRGREEGAVPEC